MKYYESPVMVTVQKMSTVCNEEIDNHVMQVVQKIGIEVDKEELIKAIRYDRGQYEKGYADGKDDECKFREALDSIVWYNGHYEWLKKLRDDLEAWDNGFFPYQGDIEWHTEQHCIWMLLVGMFGDWGTSIRTGWIEDIAGCIKFIDEICKESWEAAAERDKE
jgi:hypothetical protein